jgi:hypothetical protein
MLLFGIAPKSNQKGLENPIGLPAYNTPTADFLPPRAGQGSALFKQQTG